MSPLEKLQRLKSLSLELETDTYTYKRKKWESLLGQVGLMLLEPQRGYCEQTPSNLVTFAETGGGSVHFGFWDDGNGIRTSTPVAIVVPEMAHTEVVAKDFDEFLSIGCINGWKLLEMLAYKERSEALEIYSSPEPRSELNWPQKENLLTAIRKDLSIVWKPINLTNKVSPTR